MRNFLLFVVLVILTISPALVQAQTVTPAAALQLCPDDNYNDLDTISIIESAFTDFTAGESDVTYTLLLPNGFQFQPFTGNVFLSDSFSNTSFTVYPDSVLITYSINGGSGTGIDSIIITGLRVRSSTASLAAMDIDRGGTATHATNAPGANSHGSLSSGQSLSGISVTSTDITCNGDGDGTLTVNITSGNTPYQYSLDFGSTYPYSASPITSLGSGGFVVTVQDALGCIVNSSNVGIIDEPSTISEQTVSKVDISCNGLTDGIITAIANGGTGAISFSTSGIGGPYSTLSGDTATGLGAGPYDIYFEDANGCQVDGTDATIIEPSIITPSAATKNDISCNGLTDGNLTANASGGTGALMYSINGIAGPFNINEGSPANNLSGATYDIYFEDANGCQVDAADVNIIEPSLITESSASRTNVICNGDNDGTITATASGGTGLITYSVNGISGPYSTPSGATTTSLSPGAYSVYYQDANGCQVSGSSFSITEPNAIVENNVTKTDIICNNDNDGTITALASGGTNPITFSINGSGGPFSFVNGATATSLTSGIKDVFFSDGNGCTLDGTDQNIINPSVILIAAPTLMDPTFVGGANGSIIFGAVSGGAGSYTYSINNGSNYQTSPVFNNLTAGAYTLIARDANLCFTIYGIVNLNDPGNVTGGQVEFFNGRFDTTICNGNVASLTIFSDTVEPGFDSLRWEVSPNGASWSPIFVAGAASNYIINGPHTTERFYRRQTYKGGDFATSNVVQRKINNGNVILITIPQDTICIEDGMQTFSGNPAPISPAIGVFSLVSGSGLTDNGNGLSSFDPTVSGAGTFTIEYNYTNEFGCVSSNTSDILVNENTSVSFVDQTNYLTTDPAFTLTGGSPAGGTYGGPGVFGVQFFPGLTGAGSFNLDYTQIDANGCSDTDLLNVTVSTVGSGDIVGEQPNYCSDEELDTITGIPASGGTPVGFIAIPGLLTPLGTTQAIINPNALPGNYILVFEYNLGASTLNVTANIRINTAPVASINTNGSSVFCLNDPVRTLNGIPSSGSVQVFSGNGISNFGSTADFSPITANTGNSIITYIYEDANGCNDTATTTLTVNPIPNPSMTFSQDGDYCSNDLTDLITGSPLPDNINTFGIFSGSGLSNNDSLGTVNFTPGISTLGTQNFTYTYTNVFGCTNSVDSSRSVILVPTATLSGLDVDYCENGFLDTLIGTGSTPGFGYFTGTASSINAIDSITGILDPSLLAPNSTDTFIYVFIDSIAGCVDTDFQLTTVNSLPIVAVTVTDDSICIDGSTVNLTGSPSPIGLDQTQFKNVTSQFNNTATYNPVVQGIGFDTVYYIFRKVYPGNTCVDSASLVMRVNPLPQVAFVFTDKNTGDTITDLRFCSNEDSILLKGNQNGGVFTSSNANISNIGSGQAYMSPMQTLSQFSAGLKTITYNYIDPITGCFNDSAMSFQINQIPDNFGIASNPSSAFSFDPPILNKFCTEDDTIDVFRFYKPIPGNTGTGEFKIIPNTGASPGGLIGNLTNDSVQFLSALPSGSNYEIRYIFTDTVTGCIDSVSKLIEIEAEPFLGVRLFNTVLTQTVINNINNDTIPICLNGDSIYFEGLSDSTLTSEVDYNESIFRDITDPATIDSINISGKAYRAFFPNRTNIIGQHTVQFEYTSNTGCQDVFTFIVDVLDTPQIDLVLDSTFLTITGSNPELCKSVDSLLVRPDSILSGYGSISLSGTPFIPSEVFGNLVAGNPNDTLLIIKPNEITQNILNPSDYTLTYFFKETNTGPECTSQITQNFRVNPLPRLVNNSFSLPLTYCEYDTIDLLSGNGGITNFDSGFFKGPGITNISNDSAVFNPSSIIPAFTDQGTTDSITYIVQNTYGCQDSLTKAVTIHPKPNIEFTIQDTVSSLSLFCRSDQGNYIINEVQPSGVLSGVTFRSYQIGGSPIGNVFTPQFLPVGPNKIFIEFHTQNGNCVDIDSQDIYIYADPIAGFEIDQFCLTDPINFTDTSLDNNTPGNLADSIVSWQWTLAPNVTDTVQNPIFDYSSQGQGTYNIELVVTNSIGCENDTDRDVYFGEPPVAKFSFDDICEDTDIRFTNSSDNIDSVSSGGVKWRRSLYPFNPNNILDTFDASGFIDVSFNDPGAYAMQLDLEASYGCQDDTIIRVDIRPIIDLSNGAVYNSNFNSDTIEWRPVSLGTDYSWEQAVPNNTRISQGPNDPNELVWVTNATGRYNSQEKSYVEGPCFDFSRVLRPMIIFDYFSDLATNDGVVLQYSKNRGQSWKTVGLEETGLEWYNESSIAGNPGNQTLGQVGWSIQDSDWKEGRHQLDTLRNSPPLGSNNPFVRLRFALGGANGSIGLREGFAFANVEIKDRDKLTLIEHFTNINDPSARQGDSDHNELMSSNRNKYDILDIQYHTDFPGPDPINIDNSLEQGARSLFYGVSTIPRTVFEGNVFNNVTSTWVSSSNELDNGKQRFVAQRILEDAKFNIDLNVTKTNSDLSGTVTFTANEDLIPGREYTAFVAVVEKYIPISEFQGGPIQIPQDVEFKSVFKKFLPQASGTNISTLTNSGDSRAINFNWNYSNVYNQDSIYIVAFIQDNITREVYQVATDDTTNIWVPNSIDNSSIVKKSTEFKLYPNPSAGNSIVQLLNPAEGLELLTLYNQMGHTILSEEIIPGTKTVFLNLRDYAAGVYIVQIAHPKYGLKRSKLVITK